MRVQELDGCPGYAPGCTSPACMHGSNDACSGISKQHGEAISRAHSKRTSGLRAYQNVGALLLHAAWARA